MTAPSNRGTLEPSIEISWFKTAFGGTLSKVIVTRSEFEKRVIAEKQLAEAKTELARVRFLLRFSEQELRAANELAEVKRINASKIANLERQLQFAILSAKLEIVNQELKDAQLLANTKLELSLQLAAAENRALLVTAQSETNLERAEKEFAFRELQFVQESQLTPESLLEILEPSLETTIRENIVKELLANNQIQTVSNEKLEQRIDEGI